MGGKSCQLVANETSLWRYPNLQGANVYDTPSASPSSLFSPPTCASPICPCTQPSAVVKRGNSGALCVIIHTWPWPPVLLSGKKRRKKRNALGMANVKILNWHMAKAILLFYPSSSPRTRTETHTHQLLQIDVSIQWGSLPHLPSVPNFP